MTETVLQMRPLVQTDTGVRRSHAWRTDKSSTSELKRAKVIAIQPDQSRRIRNRKTYDRAKWDDVWAALANWGEFVATDDIPAPKRWAIGLLDEFAKEAQFHGKAQPRPYFSSDGEIGFRWLSADTRASISITIDGDFFGLIAKAGQVPFRLRGLANWLDARDEFISNLP